MRKKSLGIAACSIMLAAGLARADVRDDIESCGPSDAQCVGLALLDFMEQNFQQIKRLIRNGGGGGGGDDSGPSDGVLTAGVYTLQTGQSPVCLSVDLQPRISSGQLRRVDLTCLPAGQLYRFECSDGFNCADASGNRLEAYDNDIVDVTISGRYAVYERDPTLYDGKPRVTGAGILEVFHSGEWRGVCDDNFTDAAGRVVCQELGLSFAGFTSANGNGQFWIDDLTCAGNESRVTACQRAAWGAHNCSAGEHVALRCQ